MCQESEWNRLYVCSYPELKSTLINGPEKGRREEVVGCTPSLTHFLLDLLLLSVRLR